MKRIKTIRIEGENKKEESIKNPTIYFLNPEYVYFSLENAKILKNLNDRVLLGEAIIKKNNNSLIHSSVSGYIESIDEKFFNEKGKLVSHIKIKNDFYEETYKENNNVLINNRNNLLKKLYDKGIIGLGGGGYPTYKKLKNKNIDTLIINACECELFLTNDSKIIYLKYKQIIDCIKTLIDILNLKEVYFCIKENKESLILILKEEIEKQNLNNIINLTLIKNEYPVGYERYLVNKVKNITYNNHPSEVNTVVLNVSTIYSIYESIYFDKALIEKLVSFSGEGFNNNTNVYLKIGTSLNEMIKRNVISYNKEVKKSYLIANGPMTGESIHSDNLIISNIVSGIISLPLEEKYRGDPCMGCGRCNYYCPSSLSPTEIVFALSNKNTKLLKELKAFNCVSCGMCSYVCPSRIELTYLMNRAKKSLEREKKE